MTLNYALTSLIKILVDHNLTGGRGILKTVRIVDICKIFLMLGDVVIVLKNVSTNAILQIMPNPRDSEPFGVCAILHGFSAYLFLVMLETLW